MRLIFLFALVALRASADGTIDTVELLNDLRSSNPQLVKTLESCFLLNKDAFGRTIGRAINPQLSGARLGPYTLTGTPKGDASIHLTIKLTTQITFTDARGQKVNNVSGAASLDEKLKSATITTNSP